MHAPICALRVIGLCPKPSLLSVLGLNLESRDVLSENIKITSYICTWEKEIKANLMNGKVNAHIIIKTKQ